MKPLTFSATAIQTFEECPARYKAEVIERPPGREGGAAANLGTAVHGALEDYVKITFLEPEPKVLTLKHVVMFYGMHYDELFPSRETTEMWYEQGLEMVERWFERTSFEGRTVISAETKSFFNIKTSAGDIPFNYIWDRCDQYEDGGIEIIDYKTIRQMVTPAMLRDKIQARCYGLAAQIQFPDAPYVWVKFDLLRYDVVGVRFSREDNIATWKWLRSTAEQILAMDDAPEKLNGNCQYCLRKGACETLKKIEVNGDIRSMDISEQVTRLAKIQSQIKALKMFEGQLEDSVLRYAEANDILEWDNEFGKVAISARQTRTADMSRVAQIIGPEVAARFGSMTIGALDKLLKSPELDAQQKSDLRSIITLKTGNMTVKVTPNNPIDD